MKNFGLAIPTFRQPGDVAAYAVAKPELARATLDSMSFMRFGHVNSSRGGDVFLLSRRGRGSIHPERYDEHFDPARQEKPRVSLAVFPRGHTPVVVELQKGADRFPTVLSYDLAFNRGETDQYRFRFDLDRSRLWHVEQDFVLAAQGSSARSKRILLDFQGEARRQALIDRFMAGGGSLYLSPESHAELLAEFLSSLPPQTDRLQQLETVALSYGLTLGRYQGWNSGPLGERVGLYQDGKFQFGLASLQNTKGVDYSRPGFLKHLHMEFTPEDLSFAIARDLGVVDTWGQSRLT